MSPPASSEALTPKYLNSTALDSPMTEIRPSLASIDDAMHSSPTQTNSSMQPPPLPSVTPTGMSLQQQDISQGSGGLEHNSPSTPSQEEAARALELVMNFFQQQPQGFVEPQEYVMIGKLMEKLKIKRSSESLPTGLRRISEPDFGMVHKVESLDTIH